MGDLANSIEGLFESGKYADATICCEGTIFKVHCSIICSQSKVLARMVDGQFKEAALRNIELPNDELPVVAAMMRYLYTGNYIDEAGRSNGPITGMPESTAEAISPRADPDAMPTDEDDTGLPLLFNVKVYIMADIYDLPGLKTLAKKKFEKAATICWNTPLFTAAAKKLWENTVSSDRMLRDVIVNICRNHIQALLDRGEFRDLLRARGDLCLDVLQLTLERNTAAMKADETVSVDNDFDDWGNFARGKGSKGKKKDKCFHQSFME
ncbi:hypothetical protein BKA64DRAFT_689686 [Cadophora sp. MPI-SDFR-AT-0126]|nr:hypothetical protein BKA64DRAFT_689686 [Leotiomycetes sp. MPI-SDFR-AT-0126]